MTVTPERTIVNRSSVPQVSLTCEAFGIPPPQLTWRIDKTGEILTDASSIEIDITSNDINVTTSVLTFYDPRNPDESNYTCSAANDVVNVLGTAENDTGELFIQGQT